MSSAYKSQRIYAGPDGDVQLTDAQNLRLRNYLIFMGLYEPLLPKRFYSRVNEDTELADLLQLHIPRDGKTVEQLARIYNDAMNPASMIIEGYKALLLSGLDLADVTAVDASGNAIDSLTETVQAMFASFDENGFMAMMHSVIEAGLLYGDMFVALQRDADGHVWAYSKEAPAVFPMVERVTPIAYVINYSEFESGLSKPVPWSEVYVSGATMVYRDKDLVPDMSGETGIDEPAMAWAPLKPSRSELWGRSVVAPLTETIVTLCGLVGSGVRSIRQDVGGITIFSGESAEEAVGRAMGGSSIGSTGGNTVERTTTAAFGTSAQRGDKFNPDNSVVLAGDDITASRLDSNAGANIVPFAQMMEESLMRKCSLYAMHRLGANASGRAIELTMTQLSAEVGTMRVGIEKLWTMLARIGTKLAGGSWQDGATITAQWPDIFPESPTEHEARILARYDKGLVPIEYVIRELGLDGDDMVVAHIEEAKAAKAAAAAQPINPFQQILGGF